MRFLTLLVLSDEIFAPVLGITLILQQKGVSRDITYFYTLRYLSVIPTHFLTILQEGRVHGKANCNHR